MLNSFISWKQLKLQKQEKAKNNNDEEENQQPNDTIQYFQIMWKKLLV